MALKFKRGIKWVVASLAVVAIGGGCFIAGLITGHRSEQTLMSSADTAFILRVLRRLEANDVPAAKNELFSMMESKVLIHWSASQTGILDYPEGSAPIDVELIRRAMMSRAALLQDPDIAAYREAERRSQTHFPAVDSTLQEVEKRYLARR